MRFEREREERSDVVPIIVPKHVFDVTLHFELRFFVVSGLLRCSFKELSENYLDVEFCGCCVKK